MSQHSWRRCGSCSRHTPPTSVKSETLLGWARTPLVTHHLALRLTVTHALSESSNPLQMVRRRGARPPEVQRGHDEQVEQRRREEPAQDHDRQRMLDLVSRSRAAEYTPDQG